MYVNMDHLQEWAGMCTEDLCAYTEHHDVILVFRPFDRQPTLKLFPKQVKYKLDKQCKYAILHETERNVFRWIPLEP